MSYRRFRASAERIRRHHGGQTVTVSRGAVGLFESVSGAAPTLAAGSAAKDATSLPLSSALALSGKIDPGVMLFVAGHSAAYTAQAAAEPSGGSVTVSISPGLESAVDGEAVTLAPRTLSFFGGPVQLKQSQVPAGWSVGAHDETWALVPPDTDAGKEPRKGDRMTSPISAVIAEAPAGRERVEYLVPLTGMASEEAA